MSLGPYCNVLDLSVFPIMSHRHSVQMKLCNNIEASTSSDKIWSSVMSVWNEALCAEVARAFVLAYRVMRVIIQENGNNSWLAHGTPHCNVRQDYRDKADEIVPKT